MNSFGFANINFAGGLSFEGPSKEVENIDINQILDFEILPTMITIFCMT